LAFTPQAAMQIDDDALAAAASTGVIPRHVVAAAVAATTSSAASAEEQAVEAEPEPPAGPDASDLVGRLSHADSRDEIAEAVLDAALQHVRRAALFIAQKDRVLGWAARPEPPEGLRSFSLPFTEPSVFASLRNTEGFYVGPCPELSGNMKTLAAIGAKGPSMILVVPVTLKGKSVLFIFGEAAGDGPVPAVPPMKRLASMTATALEIVLMKNRLRNL
jgi:hypothetical protein